MLDLDQIANARAAALGQDQSAWREVVWSPPFQDLTTRLTDGEVADLLELCADAAALRSVTGTLTAHATDDALTPLEWLRREAARAGLEPAAWVAKR